MKITKEKVIRHSSEKLKKLFTTIKSKKKPRSIIYILGYGRSGTSILINLLGHLNYIDAHGERSNSFMTDYQIDPTKFDIALSNNRYDIIALKPILNSCDANEFINNQSSAKIIWMFRDYRDVTYSAIEKFGNRVALELKSHITQNKSEGWISNQMHTEERKIIKSLETDSFSENDWMALVWWFVNHTVMRQKLYKSKRFVLIEYNDFVKKPKDYFKFISDFSLLKENKLDKYIDSSRIGKGKQVNLNNKVERICDQLLEDLRKEKIVL